MSNRLPGKTVLCWVNLGPYHVARAKALAAETDLTVIEYASSQKLYGWAIDRSQLPFEVVTLAQGNWEDQSISQLGKACWKSLERIRPSRVVIPGWSNPLALLTATWGCFRRVPRILMSESTALDRPRSTWKETAKSMMINSLYNGASFGGAPQLRYLEQLKFPKADTAPFYNVVDNDFFALSAESLRTSHNAAEYSLPERYFLYVGRLAPEKNVERLLAAFAKYRKAGGDIDLVVVGDGPLRNPLLGLRKQLGLESACHFAGNKTAAELVPYYAFAVAFVLPSISEPWGLVVNEAMATGLPVFISKYCGCAEDLVTEGQNGFLFDPKEEAQIAECMKHFEGLTPPELDGMCAHSLARIREFSPENWASHLTSLMQRLGTEAQ